MGERALRACASPGCRQLVRGGLCDDCSRARRREEDSLRPASDAFYRTYAWKMIQRRQLRREPTCRVCREELQLAVPATDADHIVPRREGGSNRKGNLQSLCHPHHSRKTLAEVLARRGGAPPLEPPARP